MIVLCSLFFVGFKLDFHSSAHLGSIFGEILLLYYRRCQKAKTFPVLKNFIQLNNDSILIFENMLRIVRSHRRQSRQEFRQFDNWFRKMTFHLVNLLIMDILFSFSKHFRQCFVNFQFVLDGQMDSFNLFSWVKRMKTFSRWVIARLRNFPNV